MPKFYDRKVIIHKVETTEGTDAAPAVAADAILTRNYAPNVLEMDTRTRNLDLPYFGARPQIPVNLRRGATFEIDMAGSGTAATPPAWMKLNRIAGFDAGVAGASSVIQTPISAAIPSASQWAWIDDLLLKTVGARASMGIRVEDDEFPFFTYTVLGRAPLGGESEAAPGTPVYTPWKEPVLASTENTTFTLDGYALPLRRMELDSNNDLAFRSLIGPQDRVTWRNRAWGGRILGELPNLATKNYFGNVRTGATMPLSLIHGNVAGNIVQIAAPKLQIVGIDTPEEDGILMLALDVILQPSAGNDEIVFTTS
jgi:hypothetical protein